VRREQPGERDGDRDQAEEERAQDPRAGAPETSRRRRRRVTRERLEGRDRDAEEDQQQAGQAGRGPENRRNDLHLLKVAKASEGGYSRDMRLGKDGKIELIKKVPLFSKLSKKGLEEVAHIADELDLRKGKVMAEEGDRGREFFVLLEGEADVTKGDQSINTMHEGDFFGEIALVTKMPRTASVTATTDVRVLVITERDFGTLLKHSEEVSRGVAEALAERIAPDLPV
jgi:CRP/FNR family cyclic AMP-dependent transcriptional regulator